MAIDGLSSTVGRIAAVMQQMAAEVAPAAV